MTNNITALLAQVAALAAYARSNGYTDAGTSPPDGLETKLHEAFADLEKRNSTLQASIAAGKALLVAEMDRGNQRTELAMQLRDELAQVRESAPKSIKPIQESWTMFDENQDGNAKTPGFQRSGFELVLLAEAYATQICADSRFTPRKVYIVDATDLDPSHVDTSATYKVPDTATAF
ncbi:hypothetical protein [Noviherbaspirillum pedocola]|uniref:Uncharacterized protein n=1 Tax=Noviherbaspirillum pedocola TaxID=2801341 RepID=A0A934W270_9BURK|nr:hypothetical protein [Noviherbaspirillum pedocola]MBK4735986.1 hypothetical protein [Noviherbaspirillum pedocola]